MHMEIAQAVDFLGRLLQSKLDSDIIARYKQTLSNLLAIRFKDHWDTQQPYRGNGFRALTNFNGQLDPVLVQAAIQAHIQIDRIDVHLPRDFVLWIDPFSVSYRVGDHGNIMTLFEDRSRGRVTFKLDPHHSSPSSLHSLSSPASTPQQTNAILSPSNSPMLSYVQPKSTPIRISPPNSPDSIVLLNKKKEDNKKDLVLAN
ncbi:Protein Tob1 [Choanephora cucurbitarum]|uniref:Protein Tob1 n=1 Tax=Choanephora cucurbitarum TaxID=101091 RepID=A0A1C7NFA7_9FUNG|nr:Protein Tob1 [Choanephora cucurbitarum]